MRKHKKIIAVTALLLYLFSLSACSNNETQFTQAEQTTAATVPAATVEQSPATLYEKKGAFTSKDGTVEFTWNISEEISAEKLPVVDVAVHRISDEEAEHIANVLFDGAIFYEPEDAFEEEYSKAELQKKLDIWKEYANIEKMTCALNL